jgi:hypothetical protein
VLPCTHLATSLQKASGCGWELSTRPVLLVPALLAQMGWGSGGERAPGVPCLVACAQGAFRAIKKGPGSSSPPRWACGPSAGLQQGGPAGFWVAARKAVCLCQLPLWFYMYWACAGAAGASYASCRSGSGYIWCEPRAASPVRLAFAQSLFLPCLYNWHAQGSGVCPMLGRLR